MINAILTIFVIMFTAERLANYVKDETLGWFIFVTAGVFSLALLMSALSDFLS
jgi:hypothetical protein